MDSRAGVRRRVAAIRTSRSRGSAWAARLLLFAVLVAGSGCASYQAFVPLSQRTAASPDERHTAAEYDLGQRQPGPGEVQVWSRGAYREDTPGGVRTLVHIGFCLQHQGAGPLRLDEGRLFLEHVALVGGTVQRVAPSRVEGNGPTAAACTRRIDVYFTLPRRYWPDDVLAYRVAWAVQGEGQTFAEHTGFQSTHSRTYYAYYPGYPWAGYPGYPWAGYSPWRPYPYYYPYPYGGSSPAFRGRAYGPRVLARPRAR